MARSEVGNRTADRTTFEIFCACHQISGYFTVPTSVLPLPVSLCHCDTCRHSSGLLSVSTILSSNDSSFIHVRGELTGYKISINKTRFFCEHCGASIHDISTEPEMIKLYTGVFEGSDEIQGLKQHEFVGDTTDGGLAVWLPDAAIWKGRAHKSERVRDVAETQKVSITSDLADPNPQLAGYCHCRGVQFQITRPNEHSRKPYSPWPDLLIPYHSGSSENSEDVKWWLRSGGTKYLAGTCACKSCQLASGSDIQVWAFVPKPNILQSNGKPLDFGMGTLKRFESSKGTYREFCSTCGATIFWHSNERPDLIDVSVGLLHAESGARAESWLEWWTDRVSFEEDAQNNALITSLSRGLKIWGEDKTTLAM